MIRVVVFDFDGTLVDSNKIKEACMTATVADIDGGPEALASAAAKGGDRYRVFAEVARELDPRGEPTQVATRARQLAATYTSCCANGIAAAPERRGARSVLAELKRRGIPVWIASATPSRDLVPLLSRRGIRRYLAGALGGPACKIKNLRRIMRAECISPRDVLFVGDGQDDYDAARSLGLRFAAITAENRISDRQRFAMRDLRNLIALIDRLEVRPKSKRQRKQI